MNITNHWLRKKQETKLAKLLESVWMDGSQLSFANDRVEIIQPTGIRYIIPVNMPNGPHLFIDATQWGDVFTTYTLVSEQEKS